MLALESAHHPSQADLREMRLAIAAHLGVKLEDVDKVAIALDILDAFWTNDEQAYGKNDACSALPSKCCVNLW